MTDQHSRLVSEVVEIHQALEKSIGRPGSERLGLLTSAVLLTAALDRVADEIKRQGIGKGKREGA